MDLYLYCIYVYIYGLISIYLSVREDNMQYVVIPIYTPYSSYLLL